jgi:hypothetical protein
MILHVLMQEGLWDDVKVGAKRLRQAVNQKFGSVIKKWMAALKKLSDVDGGEVKQGFSVLKQAMSESGESFAMDETLKSAKRLASLGKAGHAEIVQQELAGPVHDLAAKLEQRTQAEGRYLAGLYDLLVTEAPDDEDLLREFGVTAAVGLTLGSFGGAHLLFQGLAKLAGFLKMKKTQEVFTHWAHALHSLEEKVLGKVVPDKLAYAFYRMGRGAAARFLPFIDLKNKEPLDFEGFRSDQKLMMNVKHAMYKLLLTYLLVNGIAGAVQAGASVLGVAEGAASTVKGVEIAGGLKAAAGAVKDMAT